MVWRRLLQGRRLAYRRNMAALCLVVTLLMVAGCTFQITPEPGATTDDQTATTVEATDEATEEATEEATGEATEEPTEEVTAEATEEPTEEPMEEPTEEATEEATEEVAEETTTEPVEGATAEPTEEATEETAGQADEETEAQWFAYVGTYTRGAPGGWSDAAEQSPPVGVYVFEVDPATGDMTEIQTVPSENPSFVAIDHLQNNLYVVNEIADYEGAEAGSIEAYAIDDDTGELTLLNRQSIDAIPAHLAVDPTNSYVVVANYVGASFQLLPIAEDGSLEAVSSTIEQSGSGPNTDRQEAPHPHAVVFNPSGEYIAGADLGTDQVLIFQIEGDQLVEVDSTTVAPGSGPRHVAFHPNGEYLYVINELTADISVFPFDGDTGELGEEIQTISTVSDDFTGQRSTAEIMVHPSGNFLYGSNRKHVEHPLADSIAAYSIDAETGELTLISHATENIEFPRAFNFDPRGQWLYALNQKGDSIVQFEIDQESGELTPSGLIIETPVPVSLVFKTR